MKARSACRFSSILLPIVVAIACGICQAQPTSSTPPPANAKAVPVKKNRKTISPAAQKAFLQAITIEKQNPQKAQKMYERNIAAYPGDYRNFLRLGALLANKPATKSRSIKYFQKASSFADADPRIWLVIAKAYNSIGNGENELGAYRKYLTAGFENADVCVRVGSLLLQKGDREGIEFLKKAVAQDSANVPALLALAKAHRADSSLSDALPLLQKALRIDSLNAEVRENLIAVYLQLHMEEEALGEMKVSLSTQRSPARLLYYGRLLFKTGKTAEAGEAVEDLLAIKPDTLPALILKVEILKVQKNYDGIIAVCKEINLIDPSYVPALYERAEAHRQQGKVMWAEKYYGDVLKANPKFAPAELGLAEIAAAREKPLEYRKHILRAYKLNPRDSLVQEKYQQLQAQ